MTEELIINIAGFDLEVIKWGESKPTWIFIHGFGGNAQTFSKVIEILLQHGQSALSISLPYHGKSSDPKPNQLLDIAKIGNALSDMCEKQFGMDSYTLVSHSLGSRILLWMATNRPQKVRSVHIMNPAGFYPIEIYFFRSFQKGFLGSLLDTNWFPKLMTSHLIKNPTQRHINLFKWISRSYDVLCLIKTKVFIQLFKIEQPVHIYWGDSDRLLPKNYAYEVRQHFVDAQVHMIENCGHLPMVQHPQIIADLLLRHKA